MGLYTEQLLAREQRDSRLERQADESLFGADRPGASRETSIDDAQGMLRYILNQWDIASEDVYGCRTLEEMLCRVLEPKGIMYEQVELTPGTWRRETDVMLGFLESGEAVALFPTVLGYRYLCLANGTSGRVGRRTALKPQAVVIYRPLNEKTFTFGRFVRFILRLFTPRDIVPVCVLMALAALMGTVSPPDPSRGAGHAAAPGAGGVCAARDGSAAVPRVGRGHGVPQSSQIVPVVPLEAAHQHGGPGGGDGEDAAAVP